MLSFTDLAVTVSEADAYASARAWSDWAGDETVKTAALRRGQDYIASIYNSRWHPEWANDEAPEVVKYAITEAARRELVTPGVLSPVIAAGPEKVLTGLDKLSWTIVNDGSGRKVPVIPAIDGLLDGIVTPARGSTYVASFLRA